MLSAGTEAITPAIWPFEVANALLVAERRKRITLAQVTALLRRIEDLPISVEPMEAGRAFEQILSLGRQQNLSQYEAAYLELALRTGLPLATLDGKLREAARLLNVGLPKI